VRARTRTGGPQRSFIGDSRGQRWPEAMSRNALTERTAQPRTVTRAEKVIGQAETFPKSKYNDLVDSTTQAVSWMRKHGLIAHNHEVAAELREQMTLRSKEEPLYDA
jgi:hypothetical protein